MRYTCVHTNCGCQALGLAKLMDGEVFKNANEDRAAKGRKKAAITDVGRYVDRKSKRLKGKLESSLDSSKRKISQTIIGKYKKLVSVEKAKKDVSIVEQILADIDFELMSMGLVDELSEPMESAFRTASKKGLATIGFSADHDMTKQLDARAVEYAKNRGGELIDDLAETTREDLQSLLERAVSEGMSADALADALDEQGAFGESRAQMIAETELAYAHVRGNIAGWEESGEVAGTTWLLGDMHDVPDVCDDCVDRGVVALGDDFQDGIEAPPAHPYCRCDVIPVLKEDS